MLGTFGDMFGMLNAAFSAIFYTFRLQLRQTRLQQEEVEHLKARAKLVVIEDNKRILFPTKVPGGPRDGNGKQKPCQANFVILVVENTERQTTAKNCVADLLEITELTDEGPEPRWFFPGSLRLRESLQHDYPITHPGIDIRHGMPKSFDLVSIKNEPKEHNQRAQTTLIQAAVDYARYEMLIDKLEIGKTYKFQVCISSENADSVVGHVTVKMGDVISDLKAEYTPRLEIKGIKFSEDQKTRTNSSRWSRLKWWDRATTQA